MVLFADGDVVQIDSYHVLAVSFEVFVDLGKLLLELTDVVASVWIKLLKLKLGLRKSFFLVIVPSVGSLQLDLGLDDVELLSELVQLLVVDLQS